MPEATYRIGELAELAGVTRRTVHYYINKGLIPPAEGAGVNSYYTADHLSRIKLIRKLQESYLPLDEIRKLIKPLNRAGVEERLEQEENAGTPFNRGLSVQEDRLEEGYAAGSRSLYERVVLEHGVELHFPAGLREKEPALLRSLIENAGRILRESEGR